MSTPLVTAGPAPFSVKALASLGLSLIAVASGLTSLALDWPYFIVVTLASLVLALLFGTLAWRQIKRSGGILRGSGEASWGIGLSLAGFLLVFLLPFT